MAVQCYGTNAQRDSLSASTRTSRSFLFRTTPPDLAEYVHADAVEFLRSYPFKGSELIYCDPPYLSSTRKRSRVYRHDLTEADHGALLDALVQLPCLVTISGYASTLYESRLQGWHSIRFSAKAHDSVREEWLWANYRIPEELHDMQYFGANYRERQNFKRRMERLRRRIERLTRPEQHELVRWLSIQIGRGEVTNAAVPLTSRAVRSSRSFCQRRRPRSLGKHAGATHALCSLLLIGTRST